METMIDSLINKPLPTWVMVVAFIIFTLCLLSVVRTIHDKRKGWK